MDITVRKATVQDTETIVSLIIRLLQDFNDRSGGNFNIDRIQMLSVTNQLIQRKNFAAYIAYDQPNNPIGLITHSFISA